MKDPRQALEAARRAAAQASDDDDRLALSFDETPLPAHRLAEWALIEPEETEVYSTRRFGKPITSFKRLLIRLLNQYLLQITAQQSRFNAHLASRVIRLEERVQALEQITSDGDVAADRRS